MPAWDHALNVHYGTVYGTQRLQLPQQQQHNLIKNLKATYLAVPRL